jgi:hypothetical protein
MSAREAPRVPEAPAKEIQQQSAETNFGEEYHYVVSDLRRIGILAAVMLGGLVLLSLIL